jgi:hypothetical protein
MTLQTEEVARKSNNAESRKEKIPLYRFWAPYGRKGTEKEGKEK